MSLSKDVFAAGRFVERADASKGEIIRSFPPPELGQSGL
jgi:hypothetical protein